MKIGTKGNMPSRWRIWDPVFHSVRTKIPLSEEVERLVTGVPIYVLEFYELIHGRSFSLCGCLVGTNRLVFYVYYYQYSDYYIDNSKHSHYSKHDVTKCLEDSIKLGSQR